MASDLCSLSNWLCINNLKLNVKKTKCMLFNSEGLKPSVLLEVDGEVIEQVSEFRFLGVTLDMQLTFVSHYNDVYLKLLKGCYIVRSLSKLLSPYCLKLLYFAFFQSHIVYNLIVWWPLLKRSHQNSIYVLQKRVIRSLHSAHFREHCMPLFKKSSILTVWDLVILENMKFMYKVHHEISPKPVRNLYEKREMMYQTRNNLYSSVSHRTTKFNESFLCKPFSCMEVHVSTP